MIKFFIYSPFYILREIILYSIYIIIFLVVFIYFMGNSPLLFSALGKEFAPDYNITYSRIYGTIFTGVEIDNLNYNHYPIAKHIRLKWNLTTLLGKKLTINDLSLDKINVNSIQEIIKSVPSENNTSNENNASFKLPIIISLEKLHIDLSSFNEQNLTISDTSLDLKNLRLEEKTLTLNSIILKLTTNPMEGLKNILLPLKKNTLEIGLYNNEVNIEGLMVKKSEMTTKILTNLTALTLNATINKNHLLGNLEIDPKKYLFEYYKLPLNQQALGTISLRLDATEKYAKVGLNKKNIKDLLLAKKEAFNLDIKQLFTHIVYSIKEGNLTAISKLIIDTPYGKDITLENQFVFDKNISYEGKITLKKMLGLEGNLVQPLDNLVIKYEGSDTSIHTTLNSDSLQGKIISNDFKKATINFQTKKKIFLGKIITLPSELQESAVNFSLETSPSFLPNSPIELKAKITSNIVNINTKIRYKTGIKVHSKIEVVKNSLLQNYDKKFAWKSLKPILLDINVPSLDAKKMILVNASLHSNIINLQTIAKIKDEVKVKTTLVIPKKSLLYTVNKKIKWKRLTPIKIAINLKKSNLKAKINNKIFSLNSQYDLNTTDMSTYFNLGSLKIEAQGIMNKKLLINTNIASINTLIKEISHVYPLKEIPLLKGKVTLETSIEDLKKINTTLKIPHLTYQGKDKIIQKVDDIQLSLEVNEDNLFLKNYNLVYQKQKIFATKPSLITFKDEKITLSHLWLNDELNMEGNYNLKEQKGVIKTKAKLFNVHHEIIDLGAQIDLKTILNKKATDIKGKITLLGGKIYYDIATKTFASDSDIVIVQEMKKEKETPFMKNLSMNIEIKSKKPFVYKQGDIDVKSKVDLSLFKAQKSPLSVFGSVELLKGGSYIFEDKKFVLKQSFIHFTGNPSNPLLEIAVNYQSLNHLITISISGSPTAPNITFSAKPTLTREQILSIILFDSDGAAGTNSGEDMMKMMGGAMAKSALSNVGVKLDHLVLGEGNSIEVGKKITRKLTFIYVNDIVSSVKLQYQHGRRTESVIGVSEVSQSYDIVYKVDFKNLMDAF